jgi:hypothetical protein
MSPEIFEQWSKLARTGLEAIKEVGELNARLFERAAQQQLELVQVSIDAGVKGVQLASESRSYKEYVSGQAALASEYGERVLKAVRKSNETAAELRDEYGTWIEGKVRELVTPLVKATGPTASKKAA